MARSKWIPFTPQQALNREPQKSAKPQDPIPPTLSAEIKKFGLENFGNTCYANSVLQALFFCGPFRDMMLQHPDPSVPQPLLSTAVAPPSKPPPALAPVRRKSERKPSASIDPSSAPPQAFPIPSSPPTLFSALRSLFYHIYTQPGEKGTVAPKAFIEKLKELNDLFRGTMHQDAHEFLNYLLNQIVEEMDEERRNAQNSAQGDELAASVATLSSKVPTVMTAASSNSGTHARDATLVHRLFEGILTSETRCLTCETVSSRDESFLDLSIDIEQNSSVTACLRHFSASEMLCQKNKFFCDSCCDLQEAEKRMKIKQLPNVLALHLKRFKYQEEVGRYIKLTYRVAFPMELRLFNTVDDMENADRLYTLFAIVVHIGTGPHQGHYISIVKSGGSWVVFDDDSVYTISEGDISKYFGDSNAGSAYVLYYQAVDIDLAELGLQPREPAVPVSDASPAPNYVDRPDPISTTDRIPPPGLEPEGTTTGDSTHESTPLSQLDVPDKPSLTIPPVILSSPSNSAEQATHSPSALPSPSATGFGTKFFNTIRRAPSASLTLTRPSASSSTNGTEKRRSGSERSPRPSASSPSLSDKLNLSPSEPLPPMPPLPPTIKTPEPVPPVSAPPDKVKKESSKSGGWFSKRKSLKLGDKPRKQSSTGEVLLLPPSPNRRADDQAAGSSPSAWFKGFASSQRESPTFDHTHSKDSTYDADESKHRNGNGMHLSVNGGGTDETSPTPSTASSLNSMTPTHAPYSRPSMTAGSSSSSSSIPHPSKHASSSSTRRQNSVNGVDHRRSKGSRSSSPSDRKRQRPFPSSLERALPPLPPTPSFVSHVHSPSNGYVYVDEPKSMINGYDYSNNELDSSSAPSSLFTDDMPAHLRSTTLPAPSSLANLAGENVSSSSTPPTAFGLRKATRKLSLTAPMLFGRKDKK